MFSYSFYCVKTLLATCYSYGMLSDRNDRLVYRAGSKKGPTFNVDVDTDEGKWVFCKTRSTLMKFCPYIYELRAYLHPEFNFKVKFPARS